MTSPRDLEPIRQRAALVAGNPDVEKVQSVRDRQVLLDHIVELEGRWRNAALTGQEFIDQLSSAEAEIDRLREQVAQLEADQLRSVERASDMAEEIERDRAVIARVQEYAYERNFYNQTMYISELLGIVGEPPELDVTNIRTVAHQTVIRAIDSAQVIAAALNTTFTAKNGPDSTDDIINRANQVTAEIAVEALMLAGYQIIKPEITPK